MAKFSFVSGVLPLTTASNLSTTTVIVGPVLTFTWMFVSVGRS